MQVLEVTVPLDVLAVVARPRPKGDSETLLFLDTAAHVLEGGDPGGWDPYSVGPALGLVNAATGHPYSFSGVVRSPTYDPATDSIYFLQGLAVMCLDADNAVSRVDARIGVPLAVAIDSSGSAFVADGTVGGGCLVCRVPLGGGAGTLPHTDSSWPCLQETLAMASSWWSEHVYHILAYNAPTRQLIGATPTALWQLRPHGHSTLIAGRDGYHSHHDGAGPAAHFRHISGLLVVPDGGSALLVDCGALRRVDLRTGDVTTLARLPGADVREPAPSASLVFLPNGEDLAVAVSGVRKLFVVRFGSPTAAADYAAGSTIAGSTAAGSGGRACPVQLDPSLLRFPDSGPAWVSVRVSCGPVGRYALFAAHRAVLCRWSEYFRGLLEGGFKEGDAAEVELTEADPEAFSQLLCYMYTGVLGAVPVARLRSTAELAGRLLLAEVSVWLQQRLLAAATPASLLEDLVWAERHDFSRLRAGLWAKALRDYKRVMDATPLEALRRLTAESPELVTEFVKAGVAGVGGAGDGAQRPEE